MGICRSTEKNGTVEKVFDFFGVRSSTEPNCDHSQSIIPSSYEFADRILTRAQESWRQNSHFFSPLRNRFTVTGFSTVGLMGAAFLLARRLPVVAVAEKILLYAAELKAYLPIASPAIAAGLALFSGGCEPTYQFPVEDDTNCDGAAFRQSFADVDPKSPDYLSSSEKTTFVEFVKNGEAPIREEIGFSRWQFCHYKGALASPKPDPDKHVGGSYDSGDTTIRLLKDVSLLTLFHEIMHRLSHGFTAVTKKTPLSQHPIWMDELGCMNDVLSSPKEHLVTTDNLKIYNPNDWVIQCEEKLAYAGSKILGSPLWASLIYYRTPRTVAFIAGESLGSQMSLDIAVIQQGRPKVVEAKTDFQIDSGLEVPRIEKEGFSQHKSIPLPMGQGVVGFLTHEKSPKFDEEWISLFVPDDQKPTEWKKYNLQLNNVRLFLANDETSPFTVDFHDNRFVLWTGMGFDLFSTSESNSNKTAQYLGGYSTHNIYRHDKSEVGKQGIAILSQNTFMILQQDEKRQLSYLLVDTTMPVDANSIRFKYPPEFQQDLEKAKFVKAMHLPNGKTGWWLGGIEDEPLRKKGILYEMTIPSPLDLAKYSSANGAGPIGFKKIKEVYIPSDTAFPRVYQDELYLVSLVRDATYSSKYEEGPPNIAMIRLDDHFTPVEWDYKIAQGNSISARDLKNRIAFAEMNVDSVVAAKNGFTFYNSIDPSHFKGELENPYFLNPLFLRFIPKK